MGIFIRNAETERDIRELAVREGISLTEAVSVSVKDRLAKAPPAKRKPTFEEMVAATDEFRKAIGLDKPHAPITKEDFDDLYDDIPGVHEDSR